MAQNNSSYGVNSLENAKSFLDKKDTRKAPNDRIPDKHFFDIADVGVDIILNQMNKEREK